MSAIGFDLAGCNVHIPGMTHVPDGNLEEIGREAARGVGAGKVERVEVVTGPDSSDRPAYFFSFLIEPDRDRQRAALIRTRLAQKIRDELVTRGDDRYPFIRVLGREDWGKRQGVGAG